MTQSNQSELERWASTFIESIHTGHYDYDEYFDVQTKDLCHYITANYTPNSEVADKVNTAVVTRELELDHQWSKELERKLKEVK